jgi:hypothetical protein
MDVEEIRKLVQKAAGETAAFSTKKTTKKDKNSNVNVVEKCKSCDIEKAKNKRLFKQLSELKKDTSLTPVFLERKLEKALLFQSEIYKNKVLAKTVFRFENRVWVLTVYRCKNLETKKEFLHFIREQY